MNNNNKREIHKNYVSSEKTNIFYEILKFKKISLFGIFYDLRLIFVRFCQYYENNNNVVRYSPRPCFEIKTNVRTENSNDFFDETI